MKKKLTVAFFLSMLVISIFFAFKIPEKKFYYAFQEKIYLDTLENKFMVRYKSNQEAKDAVKTAKKFSNIIIEWKDNETAVVSTNNGQDLIDLKNHFRNQNGLRFIKPAYKLADEALELLVTNEFVIRFKPEISRERIDSINNLYGVKIKKNNRIYSLCQVSDSDDALKIANAYQESGLVEFAHPNFLAKVQLNQQSIPNDPYYVNQFYLHNTGQNVNGHTGTVNADIKL